MKLKIEIMISKEGSERKDLNFGLADANDIGQIK